MRALLQRVSQASVKVEGEIIGEIDQGLLIFLGVQKEDNEDKALKLLQKISRYRIFNDDEGKMNLNIEQVKGGLLIISQFTLAAETQKGLRPGFSQAAAPDLANHLYEFFNTEANKLCPAVISHVANGKFGADMKVSLVNDGPVTFLLEV
jgi:D-tyrosyl-tRNA(Tyr) deacylase